VTLSVRPDPTGQEEGRGAALDEALVKELEAAAVPVGVLGHHEVRPALRDRRGGPIGPLAVAAGGTADRGQSWVERMWCMSVWLCLCRQKDEPGTHSAVDSTNGRIEPNSTGVGTCIPL